ncbi:MAG: inositol monophosphatase family protein, partial [Actinomycetota bacterium]
MSFEAELAAVAAWCDECDEISLDHFRHGVGAEEKPDGTPVTAADRGIERFIRAEVARAFPGDAILGEEEGGSDGSSGRRWIVDPIDATTNFVRGVPVFATLVALEDEQGPALG